MAHVKTLVQVLYRPKKKKCEFLDFITPETDSSLISFLTEILQGKYLWENVDFELDLKTKEIHHLILLIGFDFDTYQIELGVESDYCTYIDIVEQKKFKNYSQLRNFYEWHRCTNGFETKFN